MKKYRGSDAFSNFDLFDRDQVDTYLALKEYELDINDYCSEMTEEEYQKLEMLDERAYQAYIVGDDLKKITRNYTKANRKEANKIIEESVENLLKIIQREADDTVQFDYEAAQHDIEREKEIEEQQEKAHQAELNTWINW